MSNHKKTATFIFAAVLAISTNPALSTLLDQEQISSQLVGKKLHARKMGMPVQLVYKNDGTVTMKMPFMSGKGTWRFKGRQVCMNMKSGPRRGLTCVTFEHIKENRFRNSQGIVFTVGK